jgi:hypothetical protein
MPTKGIGGVTALGNGHLSCSLCNATYIRFASYCNAQRTKNVQKCHARMKNARRYLPVQRIKARTSEKIAESIYS